MRPPSQGDLRNKKFENKGDSINLKQLDNQYPRHVKTQNSWRFQQETYKKKKNSQNLLNEHSCANNSLCLWLNLWFCIFCKVFVNFSCLSTVLGLSTPHQMSHKWKIRYNVFVRKCGEKKLFEPKLTILGKKFSFPEFLHNSSNIVVSDSFGFLLL